MLRQLLHAILTFPARQSIAIALARGAAARARRNVDASRPGSWEFSGFSQNGEDGIVEVLCGHLNSANRYFVEIGSSDGIQNNTAWLAIVEGYSGLMVEGDPALARRAARLIPTFSVGAEVRNLFVTRDHAAEIGKGAWYRDPDVFSLDIDGNDYYVARALLEDGFRPKICVVEYNSVYGPDRSLTIEYREGFEFTQAHPTALYYGVSIAGWRKLFAAHGYRFVTVDRNGVNAFFVDPACFDPGFLGAIRGLEFAENRYQFRKHRLSTADQFPLIADQKFVAI